MEKKLMLPANYNVMNEEEMTYTSGGDGFTAPFAAVSYTHLTLPTTERV